MFHVIINSFTLILLIISLQVFAKQTNYEVDPNGYVAYCPCMGKNLRIST
jgi:hypothetical protein